VSPTLNCAQKKGPGNANARTKENAEVAVKKRKKKGIIWGIGEVGECPLKWGGDLVATTKR